MKSNIKYFLLFFVIISFGCSSSKNIKSDNIEKEIKEDIKVEEVKKEIKVSNLASDKYKNILAKSDAEIDLNGASYSASLEMKIAKNDSSSFIVSGPFGLTVAKVYSDKNRFEALNAFSGTIYIGNPSLSNLYKFINSDLTFNNFIDIIMAKLLNNRKSYKFIETKNDLHRFHFSENKLLEIIVLDKFDRLITYNRKENGEDIFRADYKYLSTNKFDVHPIKEIQLSIPKAKSRLILKFDSFDNVSQFKDAFRFKIPKNAKVVDFDISEIE